MTSWTYTAPIVASWARARSHGKMRYTDPRHAEALATHRLHALAARPRGWQLDAVYRVAVVYVPGDARRRDADRVLSLVLDALTDVAWADDSDRYLAGCTVARADETGGPRTHVTISRVADAPAPTAARRRRAR